MIHSLAKGKEILETSRSTVLVPVVRWNKKGIKCFDDNTLAKEGSRL